MACVSACGLSLPLPWTLCPVSLRLLHRYDPCSLGVVARIGLTTRLMVVDYADLGIIEQVEGGGADLVI